MMGILVILGTFFESASAAAAACIVHGLSAYDCRLVIVGWRLC